MPGLDEAEILKRAKKLCEQDGADWDLEFKPPLPKYSKIPLRPVLDEARRSEYLARAREQLLNECSGDT